MKVAKQEVRPFDAQAARDALTSAAAKSRAATRLNRWPRGAALFDALLEGVVMTPFMFALIYWPGREATMLFILTAALAFPVALFRARRAMRLGVLLKADKRHIGWVAARTALPAIALFAGRGPEWLWAPWPLAAAVMALHYYLRRTGLRL